MRYLKAAGGFNIGKRLRQVLPGQGEHQVKIDIVKARGAGCIDGLPCLLLIMYPAQCLQVLAVEALYADRQAIDPCLIETGKFLLFKGAGIGLQCYLDIVKSEKPAGAGNNPCYGTG